MKAKILVIGLTGGIASGKSVVSHYFSELGITVIDSDKIAKTLFAPNSIHLNKLHKSLVQKSFFLVAN